MIPRILRVGFEWLDGRVGGCVDGGVVGRYMGRIERGRKEREGKRS